MDQGGEVKALHPRRLAPPVEEKLDHGHGLHEVEPEPVGRVERRGEGVLRDVDAEDRRFSLAAA